MIAGVVLAGVVGLGGGSPGTGREGPPMGVELRECEKDGVPVGATGFHVANMGIAPVTVVVKGVVKTLPPRSQALRATPFWLTIPSGHDKTAVQVSGGGGGSAPLVVCKWW